MANPNAVVTHVLPFPAAGKPGPPGAEGQGVRGRPR